jgi:hypothetical protein
LDPNIRTGFRLSNPKSDNVRWNSDTRIPTRSDPRILRPGSLQHLFIGRSIVTQLFNYLTDKYLDITFTFEIYAILKYPRLTIK